MANMPWRVQDGVLVSHEVAVLQAVFDFIKRIKHMCVKNDLSAFSRRSAVQNEFSSNTDTHHPANKHQISTRRCEAIIWVVAIGFLLNHINAFLLSQILQMLPKERAADLAPGTACLCSWHYWCSSIHPFWWICGQHPWAWRDGRWSDEAGGRGKIQKAAAGTLGLCLCSTSHAWFCIFLLSWYFWSFPYNAKSHTSRPK